MKPLNIFKKNNVTNVSGILSEPVINLRQELQILTEK